MHESILELSSVDVVISSIDRHHLGRVFFFLPNWSRFIVAMFEAILEHPNILTSVFIKKLMALSMRSVFAPISFVFVNALMNQFTSSWKFWAMNLTFIEGPVWEYHKCMTVFSLPIVEFSIIESPIRIDSISFAMRKPSHPISLIESMLRVNVVCIDSCIICSDVNQLLVCIKHFVRLLERVNSTYRWSLGLACLTA